MSNVLERDEIAGCRVEAVAGRGGMGIVYRATQLSLDRPVAVKVIAPDLAADPRFRERFERESRLAASIDHPNVIPVYEAGQDDGRLYLVMRWVSGSDLDGLLKRDGRLEPRRAAAIAVQIAGALDAAHAAGLVHRDVKPANVLLSGEHVYLADFGLTRPIGTDSGLTTTGHWLGTTDYMAPEQFGAGVADARADVYALGCVLHTMLTGSAPFHRDTVPQTMLAHLNDEPPRPSRVGGVSQAFDPVVARALAKSPEERFPSAGDLARAALAAAEGRTATVAERSVARGAAAPRPPTSVTAHVDVAPTIHKPEPTLPSGDRPRRVHGRRRIRATSVALCTAAAGVAATAAAMTVFAPADHHVAVPPGTPVSASQVRDVARAFASAYAHEDSAALRRLLTSDVQRVTPGSRQAGRTAVVAAYRHQFADSATRGFAFTDLAVTGGAAGRASGRYRATYAGAPDVTGRLVLRVIDDGGHTRIALIAATPGG